MGQPSIGPDKPPWPQQKEDDFRKAMADHGLSEPTIRELMAQCLRWSKMPAELKRERAPKAKLELMKGIALAAGELFAAVEEMRLSEPAQLERAFSHASKDLPRPKHHFAFSDVQIMCLDLQEAAFAMGQPYIDPDNSAWMPRKEDEFRKAMADHGLSEPTIRELMTQCLSCRATPDGLKLELSPKARLVKSIALAADKLIVKVEEMRLSELAQLERAFSHASKDLPWPKHHIAISDVQIMCMKLQEAANGLLGRSRGRSESANHKFVEVLAVCALNPAGIATSASEPGAFMEVCDECFTLAGISAGARAAVEKYVRRTKGAAKATQD